LHVRTMNSNVTIGERARQMTVSFAQYLFPLDPYIMWNSVWIGAMLLRDSLLIYVITSFMWFDLCIASVLESVFRNATANMENYCSDAQLLSSFFITVFCLYTMAHRRKQIHPFQAAIIGLCCLFTFVVSATLYIKPSSLRALLCGLIVGAVLSILRISIYVDATYILYGSEKEKK
jgi:hypothetical protein